MPKSIECDGEHTADRKRWATSLEQHCRDKYHDDAITMDMQMDMVENLRLEAVKAESEGRHPPRMTDAVILQAAARMSSGRAAGGCTDIVAEMIKSLPWSTKLMIGEMFRLRYNGGYTSNTSWTRIVICLLAKVSSPKKFSDYRGVGLLDVLSKWDMTCIVMIAKTCPEPTSWRRLNYYGNEGLGATAVLGILQLTVAKSREWHEKYPIFIFEGDIKTAYDKLKQTTAANGMLKGGVHPKPVAAMMSECVGLTATCRFEGVETCPFPWNACIRQGSVEAGIQWEKAAKMILMDVVPIWEEMQWGLRLDNIVLTHIMWVDGLWLFATDKVILFKMVESIRNPNVSVFWASMEAIITRIHDYT